jgi:hypothetical protein
MSDIPDAKYIVIKRRNTDDKGTYSVTLRTDYELALHISGTFDNTDHEILSVLNVKPELKP